MCGKVEAIYNSCLQSIASPVLGYRIRQSKIKHGMKYIQIPGLPHDAVRVFIRFLYSSWYVSRLFFAYLLPEVSNSMQTESNIVRKIVS